MHVEPGTAVTIHRDPAGGTGERIESTGEIEVTVNALDAVMVEFGEEETI